MMTIIEKHTLARVAPLALITTLLLAGLYLICAYYKVPLWLTIMFEVVLVLLCIRGGKRAFRPGGWMNEND